MSYPVVDDVQTWIGLRVIDLNGINVGTVSQVYIDEATDRPEWISVRGHETSRSHLAPLSGVRVEHGALVLNVTCRQVEQTVSVGASEEGYLPLEALHQLLQHYQMKGSEPVDMVRSEEELRVGLRRQESGRVRLRKVIVTEEVTQTFILSHEELRVERDVIPDDQAEPVGHELSEEEFYMTLYEERLIVGKEVVAKERVRLVTEVVEGQATIHEPVRKERIEAEEARPS